MIGASTEEVEGDTNRALITQTLDVKYQRFAKKMVLPRPPLQSVTSVKYLDTDGTEQTLDSAYYRTLTNGNLPAFIALNYGYDWPSVYTVDQPITIRIVTGFGATSSSVPESLREAALLNIEEAYEADPKRASGLRQMYKNRISKWCVSQF